MNDVLRFDRVTKIYQHRQVALADISFRVPAGATVGLLGANGSGKSTAIRLALGLITATAGKLEAFGRPMHAGARLSRQRMGYLSDDPTFPGDHTAISYLRFVAACFGLEPREGQARLGTLIRAVGLSDDAGRRIATYSTGMKTRLGIAASLMNDPELLIWDEPTAGLDPISRRQTLELLEDFRHRKTVILSSHILGDIDRVCDRLLVLNQGQLLFDGERSELENLLPESLLEIRVEGGNEAFRSAVCQRLGRKDYSNDHGRLHLELRGGENVGDIIAEILPMAREHGAMIRGINSTARRLEDAYLKLITEDEFRGFLRIHQT